jgi:hypothetical protein
MQHHYRGLPKIVPTISVFKQRSNHHIRTIMLHLFLHYRSITEEFESSTLFPNLASHIYGVIRSFSHWLSPLIGNFSYRPADEHANFVSTLGTRPSSCLLIHGTYIHVTGFVPVFAMTCDEIILFF